MIYYFLVLILNLNPAQALDIFGRDTTAGGQGTRRGLAALYQFHATRPDGSAVPALTIADESGVGSPLDLTISDSTGKLLTRTCSDLFLDPITNRLVPVCSADFILEGAVAKSSAAADKITNSCQASNELTIELWLKNDRQDDPRIRNLMVPLQIVTLGNGTGGTDVINGVTTYRGASNDSNFSLGYTYNNAAQYLASVRVGPRQTRAATANDGLYQFSNYRVENGQLSVNSQDTPDFLVLQQDLYQHVIFTRSSNGDIKLYASPANPTPDNLIPILRSSAPGTTNPTNFSGWGSGFTLALGNEPTFNDRNAPLIAGNSANTSESRNWRGKIYLMAVYCAAHTVQDILGAAAPNAGLPTIPPNPNVVVTPLHTQAAQLYTRLTGLKIPVTAPIISGVNDPRVPQQVVTTGMVQYLQQGNALAAALLATKEDGFYNITVKDFAKRMSTRDETVNTTLNDFVATVIGVAANEKDARQLLLGNFLYMADPLKSAVPSNLQSDILLSNGHYQTWESSGYNLVRTMKRVDGQKIFTGSAVVDHPDPAGIITSRAFMAAHAIAGTNRRLVEFTFREFMCIPMSGFADSTGPDNYIGMDVDRFPGGDNTKFLTFCRSCHSNMDGMREAFARFNFQDNFVKYAPLMAAVTDPAKETATTMCQNPTGIACKMNRNSDVFPQGYQVVNDSWVNNATRNSNATYFGWGPTLSGSGVRALASMISSSQAFPQCMAKRAFRAVCKRDASLLEASMISSVSTSFINDGYDLEKLFARIAVTRECGFGQ